MASGTYAPLIPEQNAVMKVYINETFGAGDIG